MNEQQIQRLIQNLDNGLLNSELDGLLEAMDIDIDMKSVSNKAHQKLRRERTKMKKRRLIPIAAAAMIDVVGMSAVYATDISDFMQSFFNKTAVYDTVVDGEAFFLPKPVTVDGLNFKSVTFTQDRLEMEVDCGLTVDKLPDPISVTTQNGDKYELGGYGYSEKAVLLSFYDEAMQSYAFAPTEQITLTMGDKSYSFQMEKAPSIALSKEITPAQQNVLDYVNLGYQKTDNGIKLLASFDDPALKVRYFGEPSEKSVSATFENSEQGMFVESTAQRPASLVATDKANKTYSFTEDLESKGRPILAFISDAPACVQLKVPTIAVDNQKMNRELNIQVPALNQTTRLDQEIDLGLQKMVLKSATRTSDTTMHLDFALNTGVRKEITIYEVNVYAREAKSGELKTQGDTASLTLTLDQDVTNVALSVTWPTFLVNGNWVLDVK